VNPGIYAGLELTGSRSTVTFTRHDTTTKLAYIRILIYHEISRYIMIEVIMSSSAREKFSSQAAPEVLAALRQIAESQGRQFQAVLDDALRDYIDRQQKERPRRHVMAAFASSLDEFDNLYRELAK
jgi:hypothetical protein